jgi:hypothetical protein
MVPGLKRQAAYEVNIKERKIKHIYTKNVSKTGWQARHVYPLERSPMASSTRHSA